MTSGANFIDDPCKWRVSMDGYTIKTGWADEKMYIARYPYPELDNAKFEEWLKHAEEICELHNATLRPPTSPTAADGG